MSPRLARTILAALVLLAALAAAVYLAVGYPQAGGSVIFVVAGVWSYLALSVPRRAR